VKGAKAVLKTGVGCPRVNKASKAKLPDIPEPLKPWMLYEVKNKITRDTDEAVNRIINDLSLICKINHFPEFDLQKYELVLQCDEQLIFRDTKF
jgi:hypothetical protein